MSTSESLNGMVSDLIRRGLPVEYAERAASEFADHHRDLVEELGATGWSESHAAMEATRRLAEPRTLVEKTVREYQRRYWCGRWPQMTFLFGPVPLLLAVWTAIWTSLFCIGTILDKLGMIGSHTFDGKISIGERLIELGMLSIFFFVAPALAMYMLARLTRRAALSWKWLALSACVLSLSVGMWRCEFPQPSSQARLLDGNKVPADQPLVILGAPVFASNFLAAWKWYTRDLQQIGQVLLPIAVVAVVALRTRQLSLRSDRLYHAGC